MPYEPTPEPEALSAMRERGGAWAAYENRDLYHPDAGRLQFLKVGPGCTYKDPPSRAPDTSLCGFGWRYLFIGFVNLETGRIEDGKNQESTKAQAGPASEAGE